MTQARAVDAAVFVVLLPVTVPLWVGMTVSTLTTAVGTAAFFDFLDAITAQLEAEKAEREAA